MQNLSVERIAQNLRIEIVCLAQKHGCSACDIESELLSQSLLSDDADKSHVNWLDFHSMLEKKLSSKR